MADESNDIVGTASRSGWTVIEDFCKEVYGAGTPGYCACKAQDPEPCPGGAPWDLPNCRCMCDRGDEDRCRAAGGIWIDETCSCDCPDGKTWVKGIGCIDGVCPIRCWDGSTPDPCALENCPDHPSGECDTTCSAGHSQRPPDDPENPCQCYCANVCDPGQNQGPDCLCYDPCREDEAEGCTSSGGSWDRYGCTCDCTSADPRTKWDPTAKSCTCPGPEKDCHDGTWDSNACACDCTGVRCAPGREIDPDDCACVCENAEVLSALCTATKDDDGSGWSGETCSCDCGASRKWSESTGCDCKTEQELCADAGGTWSGGKCTNVCSDGKEWTCTVAAAAGMCTSCSCQEIAPCDPDGYREARCTESGGIWHGEDPANCHCECESPHEPNPAVPDTCRCSGPCAPETCSGSGGTFVPSDCVCDCATASCLNGATASGCPCACDCATATAACQNGSTRNMETCGCDCVPGSCNYGAYRDDCSCDCSTGSALVEKMKCDSSVGFGAHWDDAHCVCSCGEGKHLESVGGAYYRCVCDNESESCEKETWVRDPETCQCGCPDQETRAACLADPPGIWDDEECKCLCEDSSYDKCVATGGLEYDFTTCKCKCPSGKTASLDGGCVCLNAGDKDACEADVAAGKPVHWDETTCACVCNKACTEYPECTTCPAGMVDTGGECGCTPAKKKVGCTCECPPDSTPIGSTCKCNDDCKGALGGACVCLDPLSDDGKGGCACAAPNTVKSGCDCACKPGFKWANPDDHSQGCVCNAYDAACTFTLDAFNTAVPGRRQADCTCGCRGSDGTAPSEGASCVRWENGRKVAAHVVNCVCVKDGEQPPPGPPSPPPGPGPGPDEPDVPKSCQNGKKPGDTCGCGGVIQDDCSCRGDRTNEPCGCGGYLDHTCKCIGGDRKAGDPCGCGGTVVQSATGVCTCQGSATGQPCGCNGTIGQSPTGGMDDCPCVGDETGTPCYVEGMPCPGTVEADTCACAKAGRPGDACGCLGKLGNDCGCENDVAGKTYTYVKNGLCVEVTYTSDCTPSETPGKEVGADCGCGGKIVFDGDTCKCDNDASDEPCPCGGRRVPDGAGNCNCVGGKEGKVCSDSAKNVCEGHWTVVGDECKCADGAEVGDPCGCNGHYDKSCVCSDDQQGVDCDCGKVYGYGANPGDCECRGTSYSGTGPCAECAPDSKWDWDGSECKCKDDEPIDDPCPCGQTRSCETGKCEGTESDPGSLYPCCEELDTDCNCAKSKAGEVVETVCGYQKTWQATTDGGCAALWPNGQAELGEIKCGCYNRGTLDPETCECVWPGDIACNALIDGKTYPGVLAQDCSCTPTMNPPPSTGDPGDTPTVPGGRGGRTPGGGGRA